MSASTAILTESLKLLEENIGENIGDLRVGSKFLDITLNA